MAQAVTKKSVTKKSVTKKSIRLHGVKVDYFISPDWKAERVANKKFRASHNANRLKLAQHLNRVLSRRPKSWPKMHSSLSHTHHVGGFAVATKPVGFDLEPASRTLSRNATARIASKDEIAAFDGNALAIWVAKEAAFKALRGPHQPKTVTAMRLYRIWRLQKKNKKNRICRKMILFWFKASHSNKLQLHGCGRCEMSKRTVMGIALFCP